MSILSADRKMYDKSEEQDKRPTYMEIIKNNTSLKLHIVAAILLSILYIVICVVE